MTLVVAFQLTGNAANDDLDECINNGSNKEKNKVIGQRNVTLHIVGFSNDFSFVTL